MDEARVTRSAELDAPAEEVWRALTEPDLLGDWLESSVDLDVRPGGVGVIVEDDGTVRRALVDEVDPARRLALRWWPDDASGPLSTVEVELEPTPDGTRVVVTETVVVEVDEGATASPGPSASIAGGRDRWAERFVLLGCCLLRTPVACR